MLELGGSTPATVSISRPCAVVVSAYVSPSERKPAFFSVIAASVFNRSQVERATRSSHVTITMSPGASFGTSRASCGRSVLAPLATLGSCFFGRHLKSWSGLSTYKSTATWPLG